MLKQKEGGEAEGDKLIHVDGVGCLIARIGAPNPHFLAICLTKCGDNE